MRTDWARLRAVVLESDDWGLCAWSADEEAWRALAATPAFRSAPGRAYGRSTLESAADVRALCETLLAFRGADGAPPVWQANTIMAVPDFERIAREGWSHAELPLLEPPRVPSRWERPGLWEQVDAAIGSGVWWPELHGLHHVPEQAWLAALARGDADARLAFAQQCLVCEAVEASGEYDRTEPREARVSHLERACAIFARRFGRPPASFCPPDYRWDASIEAVAAQQQLRVLQGVLGHDRRWPRLARLLHMWRWPDVRQGRLFMPPRIAFEPRGEATGGSRLGPARAHAAARAAWRRGQPAVISTHRLNYAYLDPAWSEAGRAALRDLLGRLCADGAVFLTDARLHAMVLARPGEP